MIRRVIYLVALLNLSYPALAQSPGPWHTSGNQILDSSNQVVRIAGVNWYGFETTDEVVHGLWAQDYRSIAATIKNNGYNVIRIPFSNQMVESPVVPSNISYSGSSGAINSDLAGLNSLQILDKVIAAAGAQGLHVILDNHRSEAGNSAEGNGLWYTSSYPESSWINDWITLTKRYLNNTTVVGMDLRNEPHNATSGGSCWGCGSTTNDWQLAAQRGGNAVLGANPNLLIFVEGTDCYNGDCDWWGGNLEGARTSPVTLNMAGRLVYSAHDYGPSVYGQSWFNGSTTPASLNAVWTKFWAYLGIGGTAPVWLGEFGTGNNNSDVENSAAGSEGQWFQSMVSFLQSNSAIGWTYWALNGEDSLALLDSNYDPAPVNALKQQLLASIQFSAGTKPGCVAVPNAPGNLTAAVTSSSQINLTWSGVTSPANCTATYNVYSGTSRAGTGVAGTSFSVTGLQASTNYTFTVTASDAAGESSHSNQVSATTRAAGCAAVPAVPQGLTATAVSSSQINLGWNPVADPQGCTLKYNLYAGGNRIASGTTATTFNDTGLTAGTTYSVTVRSTDELGESGSSNQVSATTQSASGGGSSSCHAVYVVNGSWPNGFNSGLTIQNTGSTNITAWTLTWTWPSSQQITQAWNGNATQQGANVIFTNASWNGTIAPGATVNGIGFNGSDSGPNPNPTAFYLNGVLCK